MKITIADHTRIMREPAQLVFKKYPWRGARFVAIDLGAFVGALALWAFTQSHLPNPVLKVVVLIVLMTVSVGLAVAYRKRLSSGLTVLTVIKSRVIRGARTYNPATGRSARARTHVVTEWSPHHA